MKIRPAAWVTSGSGAPGRYKSAYSMEMPRCFERRADQAEVFEGDVTKGENAFTRLYFCATWKWLRLSA